MALITAPVDPSDVFAAESKALTKASAGKAQGTEDWLAIGDVADTVSFWAISVAHPESGFRLRAMPKHSGMPLLANGANLKNCQMSAMSKRLLEQHGGDVSQVKVVAELAEPVKPESKTQATGTPSKSGIFSSSSSSSTTSAPASKPPADAKAQGLLKELYALVDEVYPANDSAVSKQRRDYLAKLQPYQDRQAALTVADRGKLRTLQGELEEAQEAVASASLG